MLYSPQPGPPHSIRALFTSPRPSPQGEGEGRKGDGLDLYMIQVALKGLNMSAMGVPRFQSLHVLLRRLHKNISFLSLGNQIWWKPCMGEIFWAVELSVKVCFY